jgi:hypothetical protein
MINNDTEVLFPFRVIPSLGDLRGEKWMQLINNLSKPESNSRQRVAFSLMMARLAGCGVCNADSFRAMRGCTQCARLTIKRFKGNEEELLVLHETAIADVEQFQKKNRGE